MISEKEWFGSNHYPDEPGSIMVSQLNEQGLVIQKKTLFITGLQFRSTYEYNSFGFQTEVAYYIGGNLEYRWESIYDDYNCIIKDTKFDVTNQIISYYEEEYNNKNLLISKKEYDKNKKLIKKNVYEYDNDSNMTRYVIYNSDNSIEKEMLPMEDRAKNKLDAVWTTGLPKKGFTDIQYYENGKIKSWHFINTNENDIFQTYDENQRLIERKVMHNDVWKETMTLKYREDGAIIEESSSTSQKIGKSYYKKTTYFRIDFNGNWVEKYTMDSEGHVTELATREIEYY